METTEAFRDPLARVCELRQRERPDRVAPLFVLASVLLKKWLDLRHSRVTISSG